MSELAQIVLKGASGKGVRLRTLSHTQRMHILETTAKEEGPEALVWQIRRKEEINGVCAMVAEVTEKGGYKDAKALVAAGDAAGWRKVTFEELESDLGKIFTTLDISTLVGIFHKLHDVSDGVVDDILGEALPVTAG